MSRHLDLRGATAATFEDHTGSSFRLDSLPPLTLQRVQLGRSGPAGTRQQFSLEFSAEHEHHLPQGTYRLDHDELGQLELFLVPRGPQPGGLFLYTADFG